VKGEELVDDPSIEATREPRSAKGRIPYLDGLRGYSIITVIVYHGIFLLHIPRWVTPLTLSFGNGDLGVRIFFVLSGFLISSLLFKEMRSTGTISLRGFYERRVARIFPAAYAFVGAIAILAAVGVVHLGWRPIVAAGTYTWNYSILFRFFPFDKNTVILNHFWTLSLEEQFYLFWPCCLLLLGARKGKVVAIAAVLSLPLVRLASYLLVPASRPQLSAMFHTGADQIMWGVLAAYVYAEGLHLEWAKKPTFKYVVFGLALFSLYPLAILSEKYSVLGRFVDPTVDCVSAALFILWLLSQSGGFIRAVLEWKPLMWLGSLSFSLYIWQQLFFAETSPIKVIFPFDALLSLLAATFSFYVIEVPLRKRIRAYFHQ
jgi:peptidoglycan/LPS O-acetylase OafA/YrhL